MSRKLEYKSWGHSEKGAKIIFENWYKDLKSVLINERIRGPSKRRSTHEFTDHVFGSYECTNGREMASFMNSHRDFVNSRI